MNRKMNIVSAIAQCANCYWREEDREKARQLGYSHAYRTGHRVSMETVFRTYYFFKEKARKP